MLETPAKIEIWSKKLRNVIEVSDILSKDINAKDTFGHSLEFKNDDITNMINKAD